MKDDRRTDRNAIIYIVRYTDAQSKLYGLSNSKLYGNLVIYADDVVRQRGYCDHFVTMRVGGGIVPVCVGVYVSTLQRKTPDRNDLKLYTTVILDSLSKPFDCGFKRGKGQGHRVIISNFWHLHHICGTDAGTQLVQLPSSNFVHCRNARRLLPADQKLR